MPCVSAACDDSKMGAASGRLRSAGSRGAHGSSKAELPKTRAPANELKRRGRGRNDPAWPCGAVYSRGLREDLKTVLISIPLTRAEANVFILAYHRHHGRVTSHRFIVGAELDGKLVGCAVVECPNAPRLQDSRTAEITRLCTNGTRNVCSMLYAKCSRIARDWGFKRIITYTLESESGVSLRAAGWICEGKN